VRIPIRTFRKWPRVPGVYDNRACPDCAALVYGNDGQRLHQAWHDETEREPEWKDPGGYVIGDGPLPASVRGGED
jgi:hypothetical protein